MADIRAEALAGPWQAAITWASAVIDPADIGIIRADRLSIVILRGTSLPVNGRIPDMFRRPDRPIEWNNFETDDEIRACWIQAQAMVDGLNNALAGA